MIDKTSFKALFEEYFDSIRLYIFFKIAEKEVSDDMAQDVFMVVWEKRETIKLQNVKSLLYKIAAGLVIDYYRKSDVRADFTKWVRVNMRKRCNAMKTPSIVCLKVNERCL